MLATFYFIDPWSLHFKGWLPYSLNADVLFNLNLDDTKGMDDIAKDYRGRAKDMFTVIALLGVVPACITILISIIPKKIPVIGSKWFNVLVCVPVFLSYGLIWIEIKAIEHFSGSDFTKDVAYYLWVSGLSLTFIAAFFTNRSNTKA